MTCPRCNGRGTIPDHTYVPYGERYVELGAAITCDCVSIGQCHRCDQMTIVRGPRLLGLPGRVTCEACGWEEGDAS